MPSESEYIIPQQRSCIDRDFFDCCKGQESFSQRLCMMQLGAVCYLLVSYLLIFLLHPFFCPIRVFFQLFFFFFSSLTPLIWCPLPIKRIFYVIEVKAEDSFVLSFLFLPFMAMTFFCRSSFWLILHGCVFVGF